MNVYRLSFIFIALIVLFSCDRQSSSPIEMRTLTQKALIKNMTGNDVTITLSQEQCFDEEPELSYTALVKRDSSLVVHYVDLVYNSDEASTSNPTTLENYHKLDTGESSNIVLFQYDLVSSTFPE